MNKRIMRVVLFRKNEYGKSYGKKINVDCFRKLISSSSFQNDLKAGRLLGLFTHSDRERCRTQVGAPLLDNVADSPDLSTKLLNIVETPVDFQADLEILDTEKGNRFVDLVHSGTKFYVSMSTNSESKGDEFIVTKLFGVDITLLPEFSSDILQMNFSAFDGHIINETPQYLENCMQNFSIRDYIRERAIYTPAMVLKNRILEIIRYINMLKPNKFNDEKEYIKRYITEYLKEYIGKAVRSKDSINIIMNLRLNTYLTSGEMQEVRKLQNTLNKAKSTLNDDGTILRQQQVIIEETFSILTNAIFNYIDEKIGRDDLRLLDKGAVAHTKGNEEDTTAEDMSAIEDLILDSDADELKQYDFSALDFEVCADPHLTELLSKNDIPGVVHYKEVVSRWTPEEGGETIVMTDKDPNVLHYSDDISLEDLIGDAGMYLFEGNDELPCGLQKALDKRGISRDYINHNCGPTLYTLLNGAHTKDEAFDKVIRILGEGKLCPLAKAQAVDFGLEKLEQEIGRYFSAIDEVNNEKEIANHWDKMTEAFDIPESLMQPIRRTGEIPTGARQDRNPNLERSTGGEMYR